MNKIIRNWGLIFLTSSSFANNQAIVLSGGDNPGLNHYSQYLQTKTMYEYVSNKYGTNNTAIFFGIGNSPTSTITFPDVHQIKVNPSGFKEDYMLPGIIANNQRASKENVLNYFFTPKISSLTTNDNLLLFISDHGLPNIISDKKADPFSNNCIDLWHFDKNLTNNFINSGNLEKVCLSKNILGTTLEQIPAKHIIFEMSQCFSGGFHQMSVVWKDGYPTANPKICGFTAAMPDHIASGCTPDANGPNYRGYERSFTQWYTGKSIPTEAMLRRPAANIWAAHKQAILEDLTGDVPTTTSDYYLLQWADAFNKADFKPRTANYDALAVKNIFVKYNDYLNKYNSEDLLDFTTLVSKYDREIVAKYPQDKDFFKLSLANQNQYIKQEETRISEFSTPMDNQAELATALYRNVIFPKWNQAVLDHKVPELSANDYRMEKEFYTSIMDTHKNLLEANIKWFLINSLFLQYLALNNNSQEVLDYNKNRNQLIEKWAVNNHLYQTVNATNYLAGYIANRDNYAKQVKEKEERKQLLKRSYLYHQVIASWVTLLEIKDKFALKELDGLIQCQKAQ